jgi:hypothetical protein
MDTYSHSASTSASVESRISSDKLREHLTCPSWCHGTFEDHDQRVEDGVLVVEHVAPAFGPFQAYASTFDARVGRGCATWRVETPRGYNATDLRQVAAAALLAAAWLEDLSKD